ncbi:Putative UDP-glucuronate\\x3axylan alpha-glucuronosyltransferase 3 [Striga hermonthica]|uniref:Hexosyltransferase n=1 Tax=Striga hermonthica TaxID=68872 RepID=A0A9N7MTJ3_STRHE|nr:Putative UDP-glucuronate\\x3axylan alpha-glucuronosyltransferase 3 [Striga hermonthica]
MVIITIGAFCTLLRSPSIHEADHISSTVSRSSSVDRLIIHDKPGINRSYYSSHLDINWAEVSVAIGKFTDSYKGIGLLNFIDQEINEWKQLVPRAKHVVLSVSYASPNITWETLYPEWLDEEEEYEVPACPDLPRISLAGKPRLDLIAVKLPCNKSSKWSRDVARLHLQLEAARLAATVKGNHSVHVLLVTECFPIPNLFACKELIVREGNVWVYKPKLSDLREKVRLPVGSCELSLPLNSEEKSYTVSNLKREAYATILHSAHAYVCGAITAAQSIRMSGSSRDLIVLVDDAITPHHRAGLESAGWKVRPILRVRNPKAEPEAYNEWNYSKFRLWQLTDYDKVIFIDADLLILRNIDFLFQMPEISATANNATLFNSGVMLVEPSECTFQLLMDHINEIESYNGGDQGYLNEVFTWWHRIPKRMNFLKNFWEGDEPSWKEAKTRMFRADPPVLYVLHYLGLKPWMCFRDFDCNWNVEILREFASDEAHSTWWRAHDAMPRELQKYCLLRSKQKAALEWDRRQAEMGNFSDGHWRIKVKDERLSTCFEDFCFWESMLWNWGKSNRTVGVQKTGSRSSL